MVERGHADDGVRGEKGHTHLPQLTYWRFAGLHSSNGLECVTTSDHVRHNRGAHRLSETFMKHELYLGEEIVSFVRDLHVAKHLAKLVCK